MANQEKVTPSEIDGVQYRRAKIWQIILYACNALCGLTVYSLIGQASYAASIGFGISTIAVGSILTATRILDAITDPMLAFLYDRVNTRFGKLRILIMGGFAVEALALLCMFDLCSSKGFGMVMFIALYVLYVLGYTVINMTIQTIPAILSNDPRQRPTIGVWTTVFNYLVPMIFSIVLNMVVLARAGGTYNQAYLSSAVHITLILGLIGNVLCCIGISQYDKPETFVGLKKHEPLKVRDMVDVLVHNKPLQAYIAAAASDKIAQTAATQSIIVTMLYGIMIGNMGLSTILMVVAMLPSIIFAIFGARYAGKHGSRKAITVWSAACIAANVVTIVYFLLVDSREIAQMGVAMVLFVLLNLVMNGCKMCVTTASASFMADCIDYELDRSGRYVPAVVSGTYSLLDKLISSSGALIATGACAVIGYVKTVPQPDDPMTTGVIAVTLAVMYGLPILGWIVSLIAMKGCTLTREEMVNVQKRIAEKKRAGILKTARENGVNV